MISFSHPSSQKEMGSRLFAKFYYRTVPYSPRPVWAGRSELRSVYWFSAPFLRSLQSHQLQG
jgi:hypothetical protein